MVACVHLWAFDGAVWSVTKPIPSQHDWFMIGQLVNEDHILMRIYCAVKAECVWFFFVSEYWQLPEIYEDIKEMQD